MANTSLSLVNLDPDSLKEDLKKYLKTQSVFRDYDYEGSNMSVLLGLLAYNTYKNMFYTNMAISESFIDSAQIRGSIVSKAKELNYVPRSSRSSSSPVDIVVAATGISGKFEIPKGASFSGTNSSGSFNFVTDRSYVTTSSSSTFTFSNVVLYQGSYVNESYVVEPNVESQRYIISNPNVDTSSLVVTVVEDDGATELDYTATDTIYGLTSASQVYFLQAYEDEYEIVFGDGVLGRPPKSGAVVLLSYRITDGPTGDGVMSFICNVDLGAYNGGYASLTVTAAVASSGGADPESIESIRFRAPRAYQTQGRAITPEDYKTLITNNFSDVKTLNVYGGEDADGVQYGKIIISPITFSGSALSDARKKDIKAFISSKMTLGLTPVFVNPDFLYVVPRVAVTYDQSLTSYSPNDMETLVHTAVASYNAAYLKDFDTALVKSDLVNYIRSTDASVFSASVQLVMKKVTSPVTFKNISIDVSFNNEIVPGTVQSTVFLGADGVQYSITDFNPSVITITRSSNTDLRTTNPTNTIYLKSGPNSDPSYSSIGSIDYSTGTISISAITIADYLGENGISFSAIPTNDDVVAKKNDVIEIDESAMTITTETGTKRR